MKTHTKLVLFLLLFIEGTDCVHGQDVKVEKPVFTGLSAYYDFPKSFGVDASADFTLRNKVIFTKAKNRKQKVKYSDLILSADLGFYHYPYNSSGIHLLPSIGKKYYSNKPYYYEWLATIGILRTFYDGIVYSVNANGNVSQKQDFGRFYAITGIGAVVGRDFSKAHYMPLRAEIKPLFWIQYPYNSFVLSHASIMLSVKYHFANLNTFVKKKIKGSPKLP